MATEVNPYVLNLHSGGQWLQIDLDEPGWLTTYADHLAQATLWVLTLRTATDAGPSLWMTVAPDQEKGFYVARHVHDGLTQHEVIAYGLGKTRGEHTDRIWLLPNDIVCGGEDVDGLAIELIRTGNIGS